MLDNHDKVLAWVRKAPFDDMRLMAANPGFSYEEWFREGRELPNAVDILAQVLGEEKLDKPSGDGMRIAYALGWIGDRRPAVVHALIRAIGSTDTSLRVEAVAALGRLRESSALPILAKLAVDSKEDVNVRANACISMGRIGDPNSDRLLKDIEKSSNAFLSKSATEGLRLLHEARPSR